MFETSETIEQQYDVGEDYSPQAPRGLKYMILGLFVVIIMLIISFTPVKYRGIVGFACANCFLYVVFAGYFMGMRTLGCLIPVISSGFLLLNACFGVIYFSIFDPNATYHTHKGSVSYLAGGVKYQLAIFLFLLVYFVSMSQLLKKERKFPQSPLRVSKYLGYATLVFAVLVSIFHMLTLAAPLPESIKEWGHRTYNYFQALWFAIGVVSLRFSRAIKTMILFFLVVMLVFYSLGSARGMAILPLTSVLCGIFFFSGARTRAKVIFAVCLIVALPWFTVISNTTRILLGGGEVFGELSYRWATLKEWRYVVERAPVGRAFFERMFFTAGNVIVAYSPAQYPYRDFSPVEYAKEIAISMLPRPVQEFTGIILDKTKAQYTQTWILRDYGMHVEVYTSVEVSTIGSLWMLGGYVPVLIGGFVMALIHSFVAWLVRRAWMQNPDKGVFYFAVYFSIILWSHNLDLIEIWRIVAIHLIFAYFGFKLISPFLRIGYAREEKQSEESALGTY